MNNSLFESLLNKIEYSSIFISLKVIKEEAIISQLLIKLNRIPHKNLIIRKGNIESTSISIVK